MPEPAGGQPPFKIVGEFYGGADESRGAGLAHAMGGEEEPSSNGI